MSRTGRRISGANSLQCSAKGRIKLTTATFWRPNGKNLNKASTSGKDDEDWGVRPGEGYVVPLTRGERDALYEQIRDNEIIPNRVALAAEESVNGVHRRDRAGQSGGPTHAHPLIIGNDGIT